MKKNNEIKGLDFIENYDEAYKMFQALTILEREILDSPEYNLLFGKTQMFYDSTGRSRGGHSFNIGQTAGSMARKAFEVIHRGKQEKNPELYTINKKNVELIARIMGYSHDLGHTPLGHDGERVLNAKLEKLTRENPNIKSQVEETRRTDFSGIVVQKEVEENGNKIVKDFEYEEFQESKRGESGIGFEHNEYSAQIFSRIYDNLVSRLKLIQPEMAKHFDFLNKTRFMTAILAHSRSRFPNIPEDFIAQIIRQADKVEYMNYDFEEFQQLGCYPMKEDSTQSEFFRDVLLKRVKAVNQARLAKINAYRKAQGQNEITEADIELITVDQAIEYLNKSGYSRRDCLEQDMITEALEGFEGIEALGRIDDGMLAMELTKMCAEFKNDTLFYIAEDGKRDLITGNNSERQEILMGKLISYYVEHPDLVPQTTVVTEINQLNPEEMRVADKTEVVSFDSKNVVASNAYEYLKTYLSSLTNDKCEEIYQQLVQERIAKGNGNGIEPITREEIEASRVATLERFSKPDGRGIVWIERAKETAKYLPDSIKEKMKNTRERHELEMTQDESLYSQMLEADKIREGSKKSIANEIPNLLASTIHDISEEETDIDLITAVISGIKDLSIGNEEQEVGQGVKLQRNSEGR